jgi:hypothetical protein
LANIGQPGQTSGTAPSPSSDARLDALERKVDRILRALEKDGRADATQHGR